MLSARELQVMLFYSLLTWFVAPWLAQRAGGGGDERKRIGFVAGFAASMLLYHAYGRAYIGDADD